MRPMHLLVAAALCAASGIAQAQNYPTKPVRIIVPFPPGGGSDYIARLIAPPLTKVFGQQFLVENRPGAGSTLGTEVALKSPADGYTLLLVESAARAYDSGVRCDMEAGMAKLFATEAALEKSLEAMRIHGAYGYSKEFNIERYYRDAPLLAIGEGTNELQRIIIARELVKRNPA